MLYFRLSKGLKLKVRPNLENLYIANWNPKNIALYFFSRAYQKTNSVGLYHLSAQHVPPYI